MGTSPWTLEENESEISDTLTYLNLNRFQKLAWILFLANLILLYIDYVDMTNGTWILTPGYKLLFYTHVVLGVGTLSYILIFHRLRAALKKGRFWLHDFLIILFPFFILNLGALISGWVDQKIHGQIIVYTMACFTIAILCYHKPKVTALLYGISYLVFMWSLTLSQTNPNTRMDNYTNGSILVIISCFLSTVLYKLKRRDLLHMFSLEAIVSERTKDLQSTNALLRQEISERKRADEKALRLASIVESSNDGIIAMSLKGEILDWNLAAEQIFGYSAQEVLGLHIRRLVPTEKYQELRKIYRQVIAGELISLFETEWPKKDGKQIKLAISVFPILDIHGHVSGYSSIVIELTEKKRLEAEIARLDSLNIVGEMAACICHEVRNPMTTVKGFLQLLREKHGAKEQEHFDLLLSEMDRANSILSEFLSISRNQATTFELCNINEIIMALMPLIQADALTNGKFVAVELKDVPDLQLNAMEIRQVILNLVLNGLEAMAEGGKVTIRTFANETEVALAVSDEGSGIDQNILDKLGTPFFTTKKNGTGLGLAVCEGIISRHNARLKVETSDKGSTFFVYFDLITAEGVR